METYFNVDNNSLFIGTNEIPLAALREIVKKSSGLHDVMRYLCEHLADMVGYEVDFGPESFAGIHEALELACDVGAIRIPNMVRASELTSWED